jgi:hypothetical protein
MRGKKYYKNNAGADKKGEKERKDNGKEKKSERYSPSFGVNTSILGWLLLAVQL